MKARDIAFYLATRHSSPFHGRRHLAVVPNVSWGMLCWEADLVCCTKAGYLSEIEIKTTMADWKADLAKDKFRPGMAHQWKLIKFFWYAAPLELATRYAEIQISPTAGVLGIDENGKHTVILEAKPNPDARKLTPTEQLQLARLGSLKQWNRFLTEIPREADIVSCRNCGDWFGIEDQVIACTNCGVTI